MDNSDLDVEEMKHLAMKAMQRDREEDALRLLKAALVQAPQDTELRYLLATLHSNLGMTERAIAELEQVLSSAPELIQGRFQLGMLHFTRRQFKQAAAVWGPLIEILDPDNPMRIFAEGLTLVGEDRLIEGVPVLERGIELSSNAALKEDMARVVAECRRYLASSGGVNPVSATAEAKRATVSTQHVLLSSYGRTLNS